MQNRKSGGFSYMKVSKIVVFDGKPMEAIHQSGQYLMGLPEFKEKLLELTLAF